MSSHLDRIRDWETAAKEAHHDAALLAAQNQVTERHLRRYFAARYGHSLHTWLEERKFLESIGWILQGEAVKTVACKAGYKNAPTFCHAFKRAFGTSPLAYCRPRSRPPPPQRGGF